jgi:two-component system, OmpR family, sensor histidine kinase TctE
MNRRVSLRSRLFLMLLPAFGIMLLVVNVAGEALLRQYVENSHDQILRGSVLAIGEKTDLIEDRVAVDIPTVAFAMLRDNLLDSIFYNVWHGDTFITGYEDLDRAAAEDQVLGTVTHRSGVYRGQPVRVATLTKRLYGDSELAIIQVAQTLKSTTQIRRRLFIAFIAAQAALFTVTSLVIAFGVRKSLAPISSLRREIEERASRRNAGYQPLASASIPGELLPLVDSFNILLRRLHGSFENNRRFTANASHQMRTPLAVIRTHLALMERLRCGDEAKVLISDIDRGVTRLERLLTQLITIARTEENSVPVDAGRTIELAPIASQAMADRFIAAEQKSISLEFENQSEHSPMVIEATEILVEQLIGNLVDNAIQYTPHGGHVKLRLINAGHAYHLEVSDTGPGIPAEHRSNVFERFFRIPGTDNPDGSGLGLAIVRAVCETIGAEIVLTDCINSPGLRAIVTFPARSGPKYMVEGGGTQKPFPAYRLPFWELELGRGNGA